MLKSYITRIVDRMTKNRFDFLYFKVNNLTACEKCKHIVLDNDAKKVEVWKTLAAWGTLPEQKHRTEILYFCPSCAPAYDKVIDGRYYKTDVEVDESGKVIKK